MNAQASAVLTICYPGSKRLLGISTVKKLASPAIRRESEYDAVDGLRQRLGDGDEH
jgi:hypothetical protein